MTAANLPLVLLLGWAISACSSQTVTQAASKDGGGTNGGDKSSMGTAGSSNASALIGGIGSGGARQGSAGSSGEPVAFGSAGAAGASGEAAAAGVAGATNLGIGGSSTHTTASSVPSGGTGGATATSATRQELTCATYCATVQSNCQTESVLQYKSSESCTNSCAAFRLGTVADVSGNTLGCRSHFAALAAIDPLTNCAAAGPSGGSRCGTNCDAYCGLVTTLCPSLFEDESLCRTACAAMPGVDLTTYKIGASGDNVQCRIYHATFAAEGFPTVHCPHTSPSPTAPCAN